MPYDGATMKAMLQAARKDPGIAKRVELFRYRVPEELYDLEKDPTCLHNLIDHPELLPRLQALQSKLRGWMRASKDPMLAAFEQRTDSAAVQVVFTKAYGAGKGRSRLKLAPK